MSDPAEIHDRLAGALSAMSVVVAEICRALPADARARVRDQLASLLASAVEGQGSFAASVRETCERLLGEIP